MITSEEQRRILNLVAGGKITPEEAEELLSTLKGLESQTSSSPSSLAGREKELPKDVPPSEKRILKLLVQKVEGDQICLRIPLVLAHLALQLVPKEKLQIPTDQGTQEISLGDLLHFLREVPGGQILKISSAEGNLVEITLE